MATLFDLAQQYLNRALPETFRYGPRTPTTPPPVTVPPQDPNAPTARILPMPSGGGDGYSVYNPDPNRTRTSDQYSPYNYRQAAERNLIGDFYSSGTEAQKLMDSYPEYYTGNRQLEGIPGMVQGYMKNSLPGRLIGNAVSGIESLLPINKRAIYENELLGQGFRLNDIGQVVSDGGNINTAQNIMAGYNAAKVDADTFAKRRAVIEKNMKDPVQKAAKLKALAEAEAIMLGTAKDRADMIFDDKSLQKDPDYKSTQELIDLGIQAADDDSEDDMLDLDIKNKINKSGIKTIKNPFEETRKITNNNKVTTSTGKIQKSKDAFDYQDRDRGTRGAPKKTKAKTYAEARDNNPNNPTSKSKSVSKTNKDYGQFGRRQQQTSQGGGAGNSSSGCFLKGTLITMLDGTKKPVEQVDLGNEVAMGGKVFATGKFLNNELYDYKGVKVSGSHMVNEDGIWMRVRDTKHGKPLGDEEHTVYVFGSENRRILINNILFTDYFEVNEQDKLMNNEEDFFDNWKLYAKQDSGNNVDIINAS